MKAFDFTDDGHIDLVASVNNNVYLFINPGTLTGSWQQVLIGAGNGEDTLALGDIDGDGKIDIATNFNLFFQNSPTSWTVKRLSSSFSAIALLDSGSGKGRVDLVGNGPTSPYNMVWYEEPETRRQCPYRHMGDADGRSRIFVLWWCQPVQRRFRTVATVSTVDVNGDGRMDVLVGQSEGSPAPPGGLKWFEAPADRTQPWIEHDIDTGFEDTHNIVVADINGDGIPDFVTGEQDQSANHRIAVFYNDGKGNFTEQVFSTDGTHNVGSRTWTVIAISISSRHRTAISAAHIPSRFSSTNGSDDRAVRAAGFSDPTSSGRAASRRRPGSSCRKRPRSWGPRGSSPGRRRIRAPRGARA